MSEPERTAPERAVRDAADQTAFGQAQPEDTQLEDTQSESVNENPEPLGMWLRRQLEERTNDLQRLQAEYVNYRRRAERERATAVKLGEIAVLKSLLTVLDDLDRAAQYGDLDGGFKAVADQLWDAVQSHQLEQFGQPGDEFDPRLHDALYHAGVPPEVSRTTIDTVVKSGYRFGEQVIRHAEVGVVGPEVETLEAEVTDAPESDISEFGTQAYDAVQPEPEKQSGQYGRD